MKSFRRLFCLTIALSLLLIVFASPGLSEDIYTPLGDGGFLEYNGVPYNLGGVSLKVSNGDVGTYWLPFSEVATYDLSGYQADKVHLILFSAFADNVPDDVVVGHVNVFNQDGSSSSVELISGVNIAEWAYDRPDLQPFLQHSKVPPAYSYWTDIDSGNPYFGHQFHVSIDTNNKELSHMELVLDPASYTGQGFFGYASPDTYAIKISAITLESKGSIDVSIDIKPGNDRNIINPDSKGATPVAIFGSESFDVADISLSTITLEGKAVKARGESGDLGTFKDINQDGYLDLVVHIDDVSLEVGTATASLTGLLNDGTPFEGSDFVSIVPGI